MKLVRETSDNLIDTFFEDECRKRGYDPKEVLDIALKIKNSIHGISNLKIRTHPTGSRLDIVADYTGGDYGTYGKDIFKIWKDKAFKTLSEIIGLSFIDITLEESKEYLAGFKCQFGETPVNVIFQYSRRS